MKLSLLLAELTEKPIQADRDISGLSLNSHTVQSGNLFFACQRGDLDGREFIQDAIKKGACSILVEAEGNNSEILLRNSVSIVPVPNLNSKIAEIAARFYQFPAKALQMVCITGTAGKTSCAHFIASAFQQINTTCELVSTLGAADAILIQKTLAEFVSQKVKIVALEVAPQDLAQKVLNNIECSVGVLTNLSFDHLDYQSSVNNFLEQVKFSIINSDDDVASEIIESGKFIRKIFLYSIGKPNSLNNMNNTVERIFADQIHLDSSGIQANIISPWGSGELHTPLLGQFNLSNLLATLTTLCLLEVPFETALTSLSHLKPVPGRMQTLGGRTQPLVVVDCANTPEELAKVLFSLREHCHRKLYCIFGCEGDRDREIRSMMAKTAEMYADQVIVTDNNPRHENPQQILADIKLGFLEPKNIIVEHDRSHAIHTVIQSATVGDCILIAGKGAENFQEIGDEKIPYSDAEKVNEYLKH